MVLNEVVYANVMLSDGSLWYTFSRRSIIRQITLLISQSWLILPAVTGQLKY
jgi:hypothetical protein